MPNRAASQHAGPPQPHGPQRYAVSAYDNWDIPKPRWLDVGTFDSAADAVACAHGVIRESLESLYRAKRHRDPSAEGLRMAYLCFGEVPSIFGEPRVAFDAYNAVDWHVRAITGSAPKPRV